MKCFPNFWSYSLRLCLGLFLLAANLRATVLYNVDFNSHTPSQPTQKTGPAAIGIATNDFWNQYTRSSGSNLIVFGAAVNLVQADSTASTVGLVVTNAVGLGGAFTGDVMYGDYLYDLNGRPVWLNFTNLPAGDYDLLLYGPDGVYEAVVGATSYGLKTNFDYTLGPGAPTWTDGLQYVRFSSVTVASNQSLSVFCRDGTDGYGKISGLQLLAIPPAAPVITTQPTSRTVFVGNSTTFTVTATGTSPLTYQWRFNGTNILNATNSSLSLLSVQTNQAGLYSVAVSNSVGYAISSNAVLTVNPLSSCLPDPSGLVSWWRGEGDALDLAGTNHGTLNGNYSFTAGKVGQAFLFDGTSSYVEVPSSPAISPSGAFTVEAWINHTRNPGGSGDFIITKGQDIAAPQDWGLSVSPVQKLRPHINVPGSGWWYFDCATTITNNTWYHVALVYDGTTLYGYVNGVQDGSQTPDLSGVVTSEYPLRIGAYAPVNGGSDQNFFGGLIDEVSLYSRALSASEVLAIYQAGADGKCPPAPVFQTQPQSVTVAVGSNAVFTVLATGGTPLYYQWRFNGTNILNATNTTFTLLNVQTNQAGTYSVTASNAFGVTTSSNAVLTVLQLPPVITNQPVGARRFVGESVAFTVGVSGSLPLSFQWRLNGTNIVNATNSSLLLTGLQVTNSGTYTVVVTNAYGSATSSNAVLTVVAFTCTNNPSGLVNWWRAETNALDAIGTNHGTFNGTNAYALGKVGLAFNFSGTNSWVNVPSGPTLKPSGAFTVEAWINHARNSSGNGEFIVAKGPDAQSVQDWALGVSTSQKLRPHVQVGGSWVYFDCATIITNNTWYHVVMVYDGTTIYGYVNGAVDGSQVPSGSGVSTSDNSLRIGAYAPVNGGANKNFFGGLVDEVSVYNRALSPGEVLALYQLGAAGKCYSPVPPYIYTQPAGGTVAAGNPFTFSVTALGTLPLSYQWRINTTNIPGATGTTLTLTNVQPADAGAYSVFITNAYGSVLSADANLTVATFAPTITNQPATLTNYYGSNLTFSVGVTGTPPFTYQWRFNGTNLLNATNSTLTFNNLQYSNAGTYSVVVSNAYGWVVSSNASLGVLLLPANLTVLPATNFGGSNVVVTIRGNTSGFENTINFSLGFDTNVLTFSDIAANPSIGASLLLNTGQLGSGKLGVSLIMPSGNFPAGTNALVFLTLNTVGFSSNVTSTVSLTDTPLPRQFLDANSASLTGNYSNGVVTVIAGDYEGDALPRPTGNHSVISADWLQVGRFIARLDTITNSTEFQRMDSAPAASFGDGQLKVADWVQAGRYATGTDPWHQLGGPASEITAVPSLGGARTVSVDTATLVQGLTTTASIRLAAQGGENGVGFTLSFNAAQLTFSNLVLGANAGSATLYVNTNAAASGSVGVLLALPTGLSFTSGSKEIAKVTFRATTNSPASPAIAFGDSPVVRAVADASANDLSATFTGTALTVNPLPTIGIAPAHTNVALTWPTYAADFTLQFKIATSVISATNSAVWTNLSPALITNGANVQGLVPTNNRPQYFRLYHP